MNRILSAGLRAILASMILGLGLAFAPRPATAAPTIEKPKADVPVSLTEDAQYWTLDNGNVKFVIDKGNGHMTSLIYQGLETMNDPGGGVWEVYPKGTVTDWVTIDPKKNGGERAEIAVKGISGGTDYDIELRFALEKGQSGFYTYAIYNHPASYPRIGHGEDRFICQLNGSVYDWLTTDADRNMLMVSNADLRSAVVVHAKEQRIVSEGIYKNSVEHKYSYNGVMYKLPAYGWSSTKDKIGVYFINPSTEYIGGGASKLDLVDHMGATLLDYWTSGHYGGGAGNSIPAGEDWNHVVGPICVYMNHLDQFETPTQADLDTLKATEGNPTVPAAWKNNSTALWQDAVAHSKTERAAWPYEWVNVEDYPHKDGRANVTGQLVLNDPQAASTKLPHLTVGLSHPDYIGASGSFASRSGNGSLVTWEHDGNYYQFWSDGKEDGSFTITNVRPGKYTMHAFADGVLGEFAKTDITVEAGKPLDLGKIEWKPVRLGKQVWDIGFPDRTGGKFFKGDPDNYWLWGWGLRYPLLFPNDITYTIGKSDYHKDWFFQQVPHGTSTAWLNPAAKDPANQKFGWVKAESQDEYPATDQTGPWRVYGRGRATTWTVKFNMDQVPKGGQAYLRVALAGSDGGAGLANPGAPGGLAIDVNTKPVGSIHYIATNALRYNTNTGVWRQYVLAFDAALLKQGENDLTLTVPAGDITSGVVYDYLRLELNEAAKPEAQEALNEEIGTPKPVFTTAAAGGRRGGRGAANAPAGNAPATEN